MVLLCVGAILLALRAALLVDEPRFKWLLPAAPLVLGFALWSERDALVALAVVLLAIGFWLDYRWRVNNTEGRLFL